MSIARKSIDNHRLFLLLVGEYPAVVQEVIVSCSSVAEVTQICLPAKSTKCKVRRKLRLLKKIFDRMQAKNDFSPGLFHIGQESG